MGGTPLRGARLESFGDHRIAMAFAIAGLFADGDTFIDDVDCVATSYPTFYETLERIMKPRHVFWMRSWTALAAPIIGASVNFALPL